MFDRMFLAHPRQVGESYVGHMAVALTFAAELLLAAGACVVHAIVPVLFKGTASGAIRRLHGRMVVNRTRMTLDHVPAAE